MRRILRAGQRDRGALTLMLAAFMIVLLALAGLVIDGGRKLNATETAYAVAQEAARAGAGVVNTSEAYRSGTYAVDIPQARAAAAAYLTNAGYEGSVSASGDSITVTVTITQPTAVLSLIGIDSMTVKGSAVASLETGVTGSGS
ncbi:MAG TPA: pilus assembly protein TadG-related protein [Streptosporangiaceae bacterium]|nr:pilus assembly protein TadG-related protein [Streptosporangiaceae bacterium]